MGTISRITTFSTGDTLTASDLNGEFDNIISTANGSINADNLGVTAGQASASKAIVLDANKDFANVTTSNQIRNLTISGSLKIGTTFLPDAAGGADLGSTSLEWGDVYVADDKYLYMGSDQNIKIGYDETTTDSLAISAIEGAGLAITLRADEGDDAGDEWKLNVADGGVVTFGNDIASAGTFVTHLTLTPHATVASSTLALAGGLTVAGTAGITGVATVGGLTIGSAVINEAELETIDGVTAGTVAASKAVVVDSNKDIGTFRNITLNGTLSDGNYTFDTSGNVTGLGTVGSGAITSTGVVTGTGFTIGSAAINEAELETIDGVTAGTVAASKAVVVDANKDISSFRNVTLTGELDAATGDFSGDVDVDGTLEADAITLNGTALGSLYSPIAGSSSIVTVGTIGTGTWQATKVASAYLDDDTAHLTTTQTFSGAKTFSAAAQFSNTVTVGVNGTGYDVQLFGDTLGSSVLWDQSADDLILTNAGLAVGSDATGDVYYRDANGFLARLGASTDGHVLTTGGAGTIPAWEAAPGGGSFSGPGSSTDNAVVRFNGTGGNTGQNSGVIIDDSNNVTGAGNVTLSGELDAATGDFSGIIDVAGAATLASLVCTAGGTFGGGYGATGATISTAGVGQFNGALTTDGALTVGGSQVITGQSISVGEAPSTWASAFDFIQVGGTLSFASQPGVQADQNAVISQNAHYDSDNSWEYQATDEAEQISMTSGNIIFNNAVSGSAGANITWLERMRINANGNVGINVTPTALFHVEGTGGNPGYMKFDTSTGDAILKLASTSGNMQFGTYNGSNLSLYTNSAERMRITSAGLVGIGMTPGYPLDTLGDQNGGWGARLGNSGNSTPYGLWVRFTAAAPNNTAQKFIDCVDNVGSKFIVWSNGTCQNATGTFSAISDIKLKQDITDARSYWDDFKAVRFRKFRFKDDVEADADASSMFGVVAQELETVFPSLVYSSPDTENQDVPVLDEDGNATFTIDEEGNEVAITKAEITDLGTSTKSVKSSILGQIGLKVVQELQTRLEAAEAKITALESA